MLRVLKFLGHFIIYLLLFPVIFSAASRNTVKSSWSPLSILCKRNDFEADSFRTYATSAPANKFITTPIFYVNNGPHIGHLYSAALADAIARFNSMLGYKTFFSTGTDEHGRKVQEAAESSKGPIGEYCDKISLNFKNMCDEFHIGYSDFIRTSEERHRKAAHHFWNTLSERGHIYSGKYNGWYCVADETFLSDAEITEGKNAKGEVIRVSVQSGHPVEWAEEENYKFRLSAFRDDLKHWLKDESVVRPEKFHKILSQWIENEAVMEDLSISRPASRVPWGIATPGDESHTIYVWLDALINYLTVLGYPEESFRHYWPPTVQVIGKDILKFHGVFWPAFLIAAGLEPPKTLLCHSHWTVNGEKMSKSKMNVISPFDAALNYSPEGLRYFLLRESVPHKDSNYCQNSAGKILNADLADNLGNLVRRCTSDLINPKKEIPNPKIFACVLKSEPAIILRKALESLNATAANNYEQFYIHHTVDAVMSTLHGANQMFNHHKPWELRKMTSDVAAMNELKAVISLTLETVRICALVLSPVIPKLTSDLLDFLQVPQESRTWKDTNPSYLQASFSEQDRHYSKDCRFFEKVRTCKV